MKKTEVTKALVEMVQSVVEPLGFTKNKGEDGWRYFKKTDFGFDEILILTWDYETVLYVDLAFSVRIDKLNEVFNPFSSTTKRFYDSNNTFGTGFKSEISEEDGRIKIENEQDLKKAVKALHKILIDYGLPFFNKFISIQSVDEEFNSENREQNKYLHETDRCIVGITAAALNQNPRFLYWEGYYRDKLKNLSQNRKDKYEALVNYLKGRSSIEQ